ncbi:MAG TPA: AraC family transcriptional regulator [Polyangiales bacterium]
MFVSMLIVRALIAELSRREVDVDALLEQVPLDRELLGRTTEVVSLRDYANLVRGALAATRDPGLGLTLGTHTPDCALHAVSHLLLASTSLRAAHAALCRYAPLLIPAMSFQLREEADTGAFGFACTRPESRVARFSAEFALSLAFNLARRLSEETLELREVWFMHAAPAHEARYPQVFGCPVRFGQPQYALVLPREALDRPRPYADAALSAVLSSVTEQLIVQPSLDDRVSARVKQALRCEEDLAHVDFGRMAGRWGMSRRTLRRRLQAEGQQLADLLDQARFFQASKELERPHVSIKQVALRLGYAEPSSFHRAFKRWAGVGPAEFRRRVREQGAIERDSGVDHAPLE